MTHPLNLRYSPYLLSILILTSCGGSTDSGGGGTPFYEFWCQSPGKRVFENYCADDKGDAGRPSGWAQFEEAPEPVTCCETSAGAEFLFAGEDICPEGTTDINRSQYYCGWEENWDACADLPDWAL